ncbi:nucleoporin FG repeat region domain-containing protein [Pochonia chlamydosporia 170]|uniref:Nucleoporin FG repeat region domain-containing protein n=1 Tax=Pochonia chlamydosporia 170 TaxID=1380566 RepID=A0A179FVN5_METCM|nr:nucleoporin FG repeat region domain-containing protein [Pochonia chlamydosporia 170]OAQ69260.1 nucleoporin FG repeat region domain-containing protein [Pochonia chlamydosporia 170]
MSSPTPCYRGVLELNFEDLTEVTGDGRKSPSFVVPLNLISRLSPSLGDLVKRDRDSKDNVLAVEAVDADTFWHFFQFVFSGTYDCLEPIERDGPEVVSDPSSHSLLSTPKKSNGTSGGGIFGGAIASTGGGGMFGTPWSPLASTGGGGIFGGAIAATGGGLFGTCRVDGAASNSLSKIRSTDMMNGSCLSGGSGSPFDSGQSLPKSKQPYSLVSNTTALTIYSGSQVSSKRKRDTPSDGENLAKHSETQQHCISLFLKKYRIDEHNFQADSTDGTATTRTIVNVFLSHCRMWHFACNYAIPTLMDYALSQLALELAHFVIRATLFVPVFKRLVQFVYKECDTRDSSLRLLIAGFAACVIEDVSRLEGWRGLLTDVPAFRADLADELLHAMETP